MSARVNYREGRERSVLAALPDGCALTGAPSADRPRHPRWKMTRAVGTLAERFHAHYIPDPNSGCWLWDGSLRMPAGYATIESGGKGSRKILAHRVGYELTYGTVPPGLQLDHLCRVRSCVNPRHLEPVTSRENTMRSPICPAAVNARKTSCINGHPFNGTTTILGQNRRRCRICVNKNKRDAYARSVAESPLSSAKQSEVAGG